MKTAFTILELMVTLVIVGVLSVLAHAALLSAQASSGKVLSLHTLSQLMTGGAVYLGDHDYNFWPYVERTSNGAQWWFGFETSDSLRKPEGQRYCDYGHSVFDGPDFMNSGIKADPSLMQYGSRLKPKYRNGNYGYGYNVCLLDTSGNPRNAASVESPANMVVFATCAQVNTFEAPASSSHPMVEQFYMISDTQTTAHFRHGDSALAAFLDGSVRPLPMSQFMLPGSLDQRMPKANIGKFIPEILKQEGW